MELPPDKIMAELGYISMTFSAYDYILNSLNTYLINIDDQNIGLYISSRLTTHSRIELLESLMNIIPFSVGIKTELTNSITEFKKIKKMRNELIHGIWYKISDSSNNEPENNNHFFINKMNSINTDEGKKIELVELTQIKERLIKLIDDSFILYLNIQIEYKSLVKKGRFKAEQLKTNLERTLDMHDNSFE